MQSLTTPASVSKRKQACCSCRHRKKKCDGEKPSCSLCRKWGIQCEYTVPAATRCDAQKPSLQYPGMLYTSRLSFPVDLEQPNSLDFLQFPGMNFDMETFPSRNLTWDGTGLPTPNSALDVLPSESETGIEKSVTPQAGLPSDDVLYELVNLFFENIGHAFPCFHKATFMDQIRGQIPQTEAPAVLYAMCAIAARFHGDPAIRRQTKDWYELARFEYEMTPKDPCPGLRTIQTALLILYHACTVGDYSSGWLCLGKAWRQATALGLNRLDSDHERFYGMSHPTPDTPIDREEYRRTLWLLFMMDRNHTWPTGWPNAIDERQFKVDIPVSEEVFQAMTSETTSSDINSIPFTRNLNNLMASASSAAKPLNVFHYLCIANVILGRVVEQIHSLHESPHTPEYAEACNELDSYIVKFRLSLPRATTSILESNASSRGQVIWLNLLLNTMAILLHYRCARLVPESDAQDQFARAVAAAKSTAQIVKDASRVSIDLLLSVHIGSSLYIASTVLVIHWRMTGDESVKPDIDIFGLVFDRFHEVFSFMGLKFKLALEHDLDRNMESILDLRERGFRGLLADCSKWAFVKERAIAMGVVVT